MEHKQEIINTRVGGLGSSDAKMVAKIAERGYLLDSDKDRLAVMLGLKEQPQFTNDAIELGNHIESLVFDVIKAKFSNAVSNIKYKAEDMSKQYGFDIINHIDYEVESDTELIWFENKATKIGLDATMSEYKYQMWWHMMLLRMKAKSIGKEPQIYLTHYDTNDWNGEFDADKLSIIPYPIPASSEPFKRFHEGLAIIAKEIENFEYKPKDGVIHVSQLPSEVNDKMQMIADYLRTIKEYNEKIDAFKARMLELMEHTNTKSIITDAFTMTYVEPSTSITFDKAKFEKDHPEMVAQYQRTTKRKGYINIKI